MFVSALDLTGEVLVDSLAGGGEYIARVPIGYDDVERTVYSVMVTLSPMVGYADVPGYELAFCIVAANETDEIAAYWDGLETCQLLSEPHLRHQVRALVLMLVSLLIDEAKPPLVSMTTYRAGLPDKALTKYREICAIFSANGYTAGKSDVWHGRHIWMMQR